MRRAELTPEYLAEDRSYQLVGISIAFAVLTTVILSLRFYAKRFQGGGIYADDMFLSAAYVVNLGMCAVGIIMTKIGGVGRHVEFVEEEEPKQLTGWAQSILAFELIYFTSVALPKLGIICLYLRIFNWKGATRSVAWVLFTLTAMTSVSLVVAACFQCTPIAFWWDRTIPGGRCFDVQAFFHAQALPGFVLDLAIMALPMPTIWHLKMPIVKRLALVAVFLVASFGIIASIIRARIFFSTAAFGDRTFASVDLVGWSIIETSVYIITGCLPHLRALVSHYTPAVIKQAIKNTVSSATSRYGKSKGTSGFSGSKSYPQSNKKGNASSQVHALDDDAIELTRQNNQWNRLSGGAEDLERGGRGGGATKMGMSARSADTWLQDASPVTNVRSSQESRDRVGTPVDGAITVTTEVRLTRD
ncbi:integral membrane protein [Diaporthe sp. PMI_573]|nr:integral membrane protein [Diaporthaceae sp. PMI_573]